MGRMETGVQVRAKVSKFTSWPGPRPVLMTLRVEGASCLQLTLQGSCFWGSIGGNSLYSFSTFYKPNITTKEYIKKIMYVLTLCLKNAFQEENVSILIACATNSWDRFSLWATFPAAGRNKEQSPALPSSCQGASRARSRPPRGFAER